MANHLFLASTPFNVLTAAMVAFELPEGDSAELGLIDQSETTAIFREALFQWQSNPFTSINVLSTKIQGSQKRQQRKMFFNLIQERLSDFKPSWIYTGNDRRIEFQYAMAHSNAKGVYLDDGTYTYLGRKTHWLKDKIIDNIVKKLAYGLWWKQPSTIGASAWIDKAIVAFPDSAIPEVRRKGCKKLPENLSRIEFTELSKLCITDNQQDLSSIDVLILLPHSSSANSELKKIAQVIPANSNKIAYKHHPRTEPSQKSTEKMSCMWSIPSGSDEIQATTPMEILLPLLSSQCVVIGSSSTALLTAKWLRPELRVISTTVDNTDYIWVNLLTTLSIESTTKYPSEYRDDVLHLTSDLLIATGRDRTCYRHPTDTKLCIKVSPRDSRQSDREVRYYKHLERRNIPLTYISKYHGRIDTNLGPGEIFELVSNADSSISQTLRNHLKSGNMTVEDIKELLIPVITEFKERRILMKDLSDVNIVIRQNGGEKNPMVIDGLGDGILIWRYHSAFLTGKKIEKEWHKIVKKMTTEFEK